MESKEWIIVLDHVLEENYEIIHTHSNDYYWPLAKCMGKFVCMSCGEEPPKNYLLQLMILNGK